MPQETLDAKSFMKRVKGKSTVWNRSKKKQAPQGYVEDSEIVKMFDLKPGKGQTVKTRLTSVSMVEVNETPIMKFRFNVSSGTNAGTPLQSDFWLNMDDDDRLEQTLDDISFTLQKLDIDTEDLKLEDLPEICLQLSESKPYCIVYLSCWKRKSGAKKGELTYGVRVNGLYDHAGSNGATTTEAEVAASHAEEEYEDDDEAPELTQQVDEPVEFDEEDPSTWVGYAAKIEVDDEEVEVDILSYDEDKEEFTCTDGDEEYTISPDDIVDWVDE